MRPIGGPHKKPVAKYRNVPLESSASATPHYERQSANGESPQRGASQRGTRPDDTTMHSDNRRRTTVVRSIHRATHCIGIYIASIHRLQCRLSIICHHCAIYAQSVSDRHDVWNVYITQQVRQMCHHAAAVYGCNVKEGYRETSTHFYVYYNYMIVMYRIVKFTLRLEPDS